MSFEIINGQGRIILANVVLTPVQADQKVSISISTIFPRPSLAIFKSGTDITANVFPRAIDGTEIYPSPENLVTALTFDYEGKIPDSFLNNSMPVYIEGEGEDFSR